MLKVLVHALSVNILLLDDSFHQKLRLLLHFHHALQVSPQFIVIRLQLLVVLLELLEFVVDKHLEASILAQQVLVSLRSIYFRVIREVRLI